MVITDDRVQSVLRTYTRELQRSRLLPSSGPDAGEADSGTETVSISSEGKRRLMIDRLTTQVLDKMCPKQDDGAGPAGKESVNGGPAAEGNK
ncbi:MAG TPA: DVU0524 family FlgM-associated protein [Syntrophobacteraceae bacterium]|nr:DVU0524 family FlgM-associated protein [Syntrophobacteraceae bacterium]